MVLSLYSIPLFLITKKSINSTIGMKHHKYNILENRRSEGSSICIVLNHFGKNTLFFMILGILATFPVFSQTSSVEEVQQKIYEERISKAYLYRTYIPSDLFDAFKQLVKLTDSKSLEKFKNVPEEIAVKKLHFSLGRWIIHNWQFYEGSRLSHHIRQMGITYPDDMAAFIIRSFHRHLNQQPLDVKGQVIAVQKRIEAERQEELEKSKVIDSFTRVREKN